MDGWKEASRLGRSNRRSHATIIWRIMGNLKYIWNNNILSTDWTGRENNLELVYFARDSYYQNESIHLKVGVT